MKKATSGFTIVELLIVIVVIAVLASITIVAYNGIQQRAQDSQRKSDLAQITKALHIYNVDNGNYVGDGNGGSSDCGNNGTGYGWFNYDYDGSTTTLKSIAQCLVDGNALSRELKDPSGLSRCDTTNVVCRAYMKITCNTGTWLYASLESEPAGQDGPTNNTCSSASTWDTTFGMNYAVKVN